ncbi:MAG: DUF4097 family beta strand repeat protein [Candidatus Eremiobacteraeota bacterium]|nr:DUF4097 family beta strand repeat protein [Candidatus Eremiobacteraeota bacterium]
MRNDVGSIEAYAPEMGQTPATYTVEFFGPAEQQPKVTKSGAVVTVAPAGFTTNNRYLLRAPKNTTLSISTQNGSINVEDVDAVVNAETGTGAINVMSLQYANARTGAGNIQASFGSTDWTGTLHFGATKGDVVVYVNATANSHVHLHTAHGSIFTDFPLRGTSSGQSETIDGVLNGGARRAIDIEVGEGVIRLLQLKPQA